jgi:glycosyltransferase involved in cell wall biosynthesis
MKVSIVTISFNQVKFLPRAIESVLQQDFPGIEYIIVDPGSTDGGREIIERYRSRFHAVIFASDDGPADGLNSGFDAATGDIFGFLNSDDALCPGAVSAAVRYLSQHPDMDVVSGHAKVIGPDGRVRRLAYSDRWSNYKYLYGAAVLIQPSTFFRRSAFERAGKFNSENTVDWDGELFFNMEKAGCKFGRSEEIWSEYRVHPESLSVLMNRRERSASAWDRRFRQLKNRDPDNWDKAMKLALRCWKHLANPRDTIQRVLRGPVIGRSLD